VRGEWLTEGNYGKFVGNLWQFVFKRTDFCAVVEKTFLCENFGRLEKIAYLCGMKQNLGNG